MIVAYDVSETAIDTFVIDMRFGCKMPYTQAIHPLRHRRETPKGDSDVVDGDSWMSVGDKRREELDEEGMRSLKY